MIGPFFLRGRYTLSYLRIHFLRPIIQHPPLPPHTAVFPTYTLPYLRIPLLLGPIQQRLRRPIPASPFFLNVLLPVVAHVISQREIVLERDPLCEREVCQSGGGGLHHRHERRKNFSRILGDRSTINAFDGLNSFHTGRTHPL